MTVGVIPAWMFVYHISRPGEDGEPNRVTKLWSNFDYLSEQWEERNTLRTAAIEQACHDKHLFLYAPRNRNYELNYPE